MLVSYFPNANAPVRRLTYSVSVVLFSDFLQNHLGTIAIKTTVFYD